MSGIKPPPTPDQIKANLASLRAQGAPDDVIDRYMQSVGATPVDADFSDVQSGSSTSAPRNPVGHLEGLSQFAVQGATLGLGEEGEAALNAFSPSALGRSLAKGENPISHYQETRDALRSRMKSYRDENPGKATLAELGGGLVTAPLGGELGMIRSGIAYGGLSGFGHAEGDAGQQAKGAAGGAAAGGVIGGTLSALRRPAAAIGGAILTRTGLRDALSKILPGVQSTKDVARQFVQRQFERDAINEAGAQANAVNPANIYRSVAQTPEVVADVGGESVKKALGGLQSMPGSTAEKATSQLETRAAGMKDRILNYTRHILQVSRTDADRLGKELIADKVAGAKPLYDKAYAHGAVDDDTINQLLQNRWFKAAWPRARGIAEDEGHQLPEIYKTVMKESDIVDAAGNKIMVPVQELVKVPDVRTLDYIKRALDGTIKRGLDAEGKPGLISSEGHAVRGLWNRFVSRLDELVPDYKVARDFISSAADGQDALAAGQQIFKPAQRLTADDVAAMSNGERELYLVGAFKAIRDKLSSTSRGMIGEQQRDLTNLLTDDVLEQLRTASRSPDEFESLLDVLRHERGMANTLSHLRGSRTVPIGQQVAEIEGVAPEVFGATGQMMRGNVLGGAGQLARALFSSKMPRPTGGVAEAAGDMLLQPATPQNISNIFQPVQQSQPLGTRVAAGLAGGGMAPTLSNNAQMGQMEAVQLRSQGLTNAQLEQMLGQRYTPEVVRFLVASTPQRVPQQ